MDDDQLEQTMRDGLRSRANDVEVDTAYAATARTGARNRRRTRLGLVAVATAAVVVPIAVIAQQAGSPQEADEPVASGPTTSGETTTVVPPDWRVESYDGVQLRVPPDWGWGGAPAPEPGVVGTAAEPRTENLYWCGRGAFAYPGDDGRTHFEEEVDMPYVGRATYTMTDMCIGGQQFSPSHPWVWFGTPIDVGIVELANGFVQQTVDVGGVRVTVGDDDSAELATILGSVEAVGVDDNGCDSRARSASQLQPPDAAADPLESLGRVESVSVCAYRHTDDEAVRLGYSTRVEGERAQQVGDEIAATRAVVIACTEPPPRLDTVVLRIVTADNDFVVVTQLDGCPAGYDTNFGTRHFSRANVEPWVSDGVGLYVAGGMVGNALRGLYSMPG